MIYGITAFYIVATVVALGCLIFSVYRVKTYAKSIPIGALTVLLFMGMTVAIFYVAPRIQGWATTEEIPPYSIISSIKVLEPKGGDPGGVYVFCFPRVIEPRSLGQSIVFVFKEQKKPYVPRLYKLPYTEERHQKLVETEKKRRAQPGSNLFVDDSGAIAVLNPHKALPPKDDPKP